MPTSPELEPHRQRKMAESFGTDPERYDRARPRYPEEMVSRILAASPGRDLLDVGCGTGIAARQFQAAGATVLGVDVDARMTEQARRTGLAVEVGAFEAWDAAGRTFDVVVAAQSWHWVDPVAGAVKAAEVLRPNGRLALCWNAFQFPRDLALRIAEVHERLLPDTPAFGNVTAPALDMYKLLLGKATAGIEQSGAFGAVEEWRFDWARSYTRDELLDLLPTTGPYGQLPEEVRADLLTGMGAAVDAVGGSFTMSFAAVVATAALTG